MSETMTVPLFAVSLEVDGKLMYLMDSPDPQVNMTMGANATPLSQSEAQRWVSILSNPEEEVNARLSNIKIIPFPPPTITL